jgi:hypothetical protein
MTKPLAEEPVVLSAEEGTLEVCCALCTCAVQLCRQPQNNQNNQNQNNQNNQNQNQNRNRNN